MSFKEDKTAMRLNLHKLVKPVAVCCFCVFLCASAYPAYAGAPPSFSPHDFTKPEITCNQNFDIADKQTSKAREVFVPSDSGNEINEAAASIGVISMVESAKLATAQMFINGIQTSFEAYNIGGYNYFKLRDLACALNGTQKQFEVAYDDASKMISLIKGEAYTVTGKEFVKGDSRVKEAHLNSSDIYIDKTLAELTAYAIDGYNFFKLRDLGEQLGFAVRYDEVSKSVLIDTANEQPEFAVDGFILPNYIENQETQKNITGLINDQNTPPVSEIKMGYLKGGNNGCGWIATYNAMYLLGEPQKPADIVKYYEMAGGTVMNGLFGTNSIALNQYFIDMGLKTKYMSQPLNLDKVIADAGVAVLEYADLPYMHYVAVYYENGIYTVYNSGDNRGKAVEAASIDKWIAEKEYMPLVLVTVESRGGSLI